MGHALLSPPPTLLCRRSSPLHGQGICAGTGLRPGFGRLRHGARHRAPAAQPAPWRLPFRPSPGRARSPAAADGHEGTLFNGAMPLPHRRWRRHSPDTVRNVLAQAQWQARVIELDRSQPEFTRTPWAYLDSAVSPAVSQGLAAEQHSTRCRLLPGALRCARQRGHRHLGHREQLRKQLRHLQKPWTPWPRWPMRGDGTTGRARN